MSGLRQALGRLPAPVSYGIVSLVIAGAAIAVVIQLWPEKPGQSRQNMAGGSICRQCTLCGQTYEDSKQDLVAKGMLDPIEHSELTPQGQRCAKCGRGGLQIAFKCPKDGTIFVRSGASRSPPTCPKCQWNPYSR